MSSSLKRTHNFFSKHPITQGALTSAWIRFGWWQFVSRLKKEIIFDWIEGQRLIARRGMTGATGNIYTGLHEFTDMMLPLHFLRSGDLFLDIGANVGSYSVLASGVCGATTWAFEPDPEAASTLQRNIEVNRLESLVTVHHVALGSEPGEVPFSVGMDTTNQVLQSSEGKVRVVRQERLDDLVGDRQPAMAKIDVEGYEQEVIRGALKVLTSPTFRVIAIETTTPWIEENLKSQGFERQYYQPFLRQFSAEPNGLPFNNAVFIRDYNFVSSRIAAARKIQVLDHLV